MHRDFALSNGYKLTMRATTHGTVDVTVSDIDGSTVAEADETMPDFQETVDSVCEAVTGP